LDLPDDESFYVRIGDDFRRVFARYAGPENPLSPGAKSRTIFGVQRAGHGYGQPLSHPLGTATVREVHDYPWPDPSCQDVSHVRNESPAWETRAPDRQKRFDEIMSVYAAMIDCLDQSMGRLVAGLKERGLLEDTLILFLSDNGGNAEGGPPGVTRGTGPIGGPQSYVWLGMNWATLANTPFRRYKHFTHEGGISTPLIAHWPRGIPSERRGGLEKQPGHVIDLMATAVDLAGTKYPAEYLGNAILPMEGVSLRPAFAGKPLDRKRPIFWEHEGNKAVRDGKWKLVQKWRGPWELYDMEADRTEFHDVVGVGSWESDNCRCGSWTWTSVLA
jgi:arylsulfatase A-like enzyme